MAKRNKKSDETSEITEDFVDTDGAEKSDRDLSNTLGGTSESIYVNAKSIIAEIEAKSSKLNGEKSQALTRYEKAGGNKKAFNDCRKIMAMEDGARNDYLRTLSALLEHEGAFNQLDMYEKMNGLRRTFPDKIEFVDGETADERRHGTAPQEIGPAQAEAVLNAPLH